MWCEWTNILESVVPSLKTTINNASMVFLHYIIIGRHLNIELAKLPRNETTNNDLAVYGMQVNTFYVQKSLLVHKYIQTHSPAKWINKQIKTPQVYVSVEKGNINWMLFERWLITKWIKHVTAQVGSSHLSRWNVKMNSGFKKSFSFPQSFSKPIRSQTWL